MPQVAALVCEKSSTAGPQSLQRCGPDVTSRRPHLQTTQVTGFSRIAECRIGRCWLNANLGGVCSEFEVGRRLRYCAILGWWHVLPLPYVSNVPPRDGKTLDKTKNKFNYQFEVLEDNGSGQCVACMRPETSYYSDISKFWSNPVMGELPCAMFRRRTSYFCRLMLIRRKIFCRRRNRLLLIFNIR